MVDLHFQGTIDEAAIFPWELSPDNIADIATLGLQLARAGSPSGKLATAWGGLRSQWPAAPLTQPELQAAG